MKVPFYCFYNFNSSFYLFSSVSSNAWTYWSCYNKTFKFLSSSVSFFILFLTPDILLQHIFRFYSYLVIFFIRCLTLCRHIVDCLEHIAFQCCALVQINLVKQLIYRSTSFEICFNVCQGKLKVTLILDQFNQALRHGLSETQMVQCCLFKSVAWNSNISKICMSSVKCTVYNSLSLFFLWKLFFVQIFGTVLSSFTAQYLGKDSMEHLCRSLELFVCVVPSYSVLCPENSSSIGLLDL